MFDVQVGEDLCAEAVRMLYSTTHNMPEPAGAIALAALLAERDVQRGRRVGVTMSGGNMDVPLMTRILGGETPAG